MQIAISRQVTRATVSNTSNAMFEAALALALMGVVLAIVGR